MSTYNTYVGARYVPLLVGDWDTTKQTEYEPLTVVQYQGNSYTSRTYVPKNIDITNTEYWVVTGNYNAQIEAYREEVANLAKTTELNTSSIASINATNGALINSYEQFANLTQKNVQGGFLKNDSKGQGESIGAIMPFLGTKDFFDANGGFNEFDNRHANDFARIGAWKWSNHQANSKPRLWIELYIVDPNKTIPSTVTVKITHNGSIELKNGAIKQMHLSHVDQNFVHYEDLIAGHTGEGITPYDGSYSYDSTRNTASLTFNPNNLSTKVLHAWLSDGDSDYDSFVGRITLEASVPGLIGFHLGLDEYVENTAYEQCGTSTVIIGNAPRSLTLYNDSFSKIAQYGDFHKIDVHMATVFRYYEGTSFEVNLSLPVGSCSDIVLCNTTGTDYAMYKLFSFASGIVALKYQSNSELTLTIATEGNLLKTISTTGYVGFSCNFILNTP